MKSALLILFCVSVTGACFSQYTVTKIIGQVKNRTTGEKLFPGSKLKDDDVLEFSSSRDMLRVIVSGKGIYVISPTPRKDNQQNMIVEMLKSALKIKSKEGYLSGRSEESELIPATLETEASVNNKHLISMENKYLFDMREYDVSKGNRFFLQVEGEDGKPEIHSLKTVSDTLLIYPVDFKPRQNEITGKEKYKLGFYNKDKNSSESLSTVNPYIDSTGEMENIIKMIIAENKKADKEGLRHACYAEVYEALGKPSVILFSSVFDRLTSGITKTKK